MPRSFLVKKPRARSRSRDWSDVPDAQRADCYIPASRRASSGSDEDSSVSPPSPGARSDSLGEDNSSQAVSRLGRHITSSPTSLFMRSRMKVTGVSESSSFSCPACRKALRSQRMLTRHLKCHSALRKHCCSFCGKGFNDTFDLKRHIRTHTGVRPYKCDSCDKAFTQRCSLESHLRKIHGLEQQYAYKERRTKLYVCEGCGFTATQPEPLLEHATKDHPDDPDLATALANSLLRSTGTKQESEQKPDL
uniref:C2H2-type domain-containing protein n=1 Tax=Eptatretus burgeri TaxID=7764 RepID=A0A8C4NFM6_EPTBU